MGFRSQRLYDNEYRTFDFLRSVSSFETYPPLSLAF